MVNSKKSSGARFFELTISLPRPGPQGPGAKRLFIFHHFFDLFIIQITQITLQISSKIAKLGLIVSNRIFLVKRVYLGQIVFNLVKLYFIGSNLIRLV